MRLLMLVVGLTGCSTVPAESRPTVSATGPCAEFAQADNRPYYCVENTGQTSLRVYVLTTAIHDFPAQLLGPELLSTGSLPPTSKASLVQERLKSRTVMTAPGLVTCVERTRENFPGVWTANAPIGQYLLPTGPDTRDSYLCVGP